MPGYRVTAPEGVEFKKRKYRPGESFEAGAAEVYEIRSLLEKIAEPPAEVNLGFAPSEVKLVDAPNVE